MKQHGMRSKVGVDLAPWALRERPFLRDLLLTLAAALWSGIASSALFILLVFACNGGVQAAPGEPTQGRLARSTLDGRRLPLITCSSFDALGTGAPSAIW